MEKFSVKERFESQIIEIWDNKEYDNISIKKSGYSQQDEIIKNALMFIGLNPSNSENTVESYFYNNSQDGKNHKYFKKFQDISKRVGLLWTHVDLLFIRETNQKNIERMLYENDNSMLKFLYQQLMISKQIIEEAKPKIIVVNNTLSRKFLGYEKREEKGQIVEKWMDFKFEFDNEIGTYRLQDSDKLNNIPVFFTSMLTGQRALDNGSYERLIWHINYVKKKENNI